MRLLDWLLSLFRTRPTPPPAPPPTGSEVVALVNAERLRVGLPALRVNATLSAEARRYAARMAAAGRLDHNLDGSLWLRLAAYPAGSTPFHAVGENIAWNYPGAPSVVAGWLASPAHRANMLSGVWTETGAGVAAGAGGQLYYCQDFAG